jgi:UDP:flavonoid glycosyltransferase YjiC (YdhE family)
MPSTYKVGNFPIVSETVWSEKRKARKPTNQSILKQLFTSPKSVIIEYLRKREADNLFKINEISDKNKKIDNDFIFAFDNVPELVLAPLEFEFAPEIRKDFQYYLGLSHREGRQDTELDTHFETVWKDIIVQKNEGKKVVYCSFGTYYESPDRVLLDFLENIVQSVNSIPDTILICAVNQFVIEFLQSQGYKNDKTFFFSRVPQLKVLQIADLFITHGGMGSIKESIFYQVPMLVYPLDLHYDQTGNALKVETHGLGLRGTFGFERVENLIIKLQSLLNDASFKEKINKFNQIVTQNYTQQKLKDILNKLIA